MIILLVAAWTLTVGLCLFGAWERHHRETAPVQRAERRTPMELNENWWPEFEREFRDYAARPHDG